MGFLEVVLKSEDFSSGGRDDIEDPVDQALGEAGVSEVSGGGAGLGSSNIDVELTDEKVALAVLKRTLEQLGVAPSAIVNQYEPESVVHRLSGQPPLRGEVTETQ